MQSTRQHRGNLENAAWHSLDVLMPCARIGLAPQKHKGARKEVWRVTPLARWEGIWQHMWAKYDAGAKGWAEQAGLWKEFRASGLLAGKNCSTWAELCGITMLWQDMIQRHWHSCIGIYNLSYYWTIIVLNCMIGVYSAPVYASSGNLLVP